MPLEPINPSSVRLAPGASACNEWFYPTRAFREMTGQEGGTEGLDNDFAVRRDENVGATIMGRNMFGSIRGAWPDRDWKGWWGPNPPYHHQVFVLTHHARESIPMEGGITFHFVTDGIEAALARAFAAAGGKDVLIGGGAATIQQYLRAGLVDERWAALQRRRAAGER